jgi:hypothetical protein
VHISYYDATNKDLKYITNAPGSWQTVIVDSAGDVGMDTSLALDAAGRVHISYFDESNGILKYVTNASGSWQIETVDNSKGAEADIPPWSLIRQARLISAIGTG